MIQLSKHLYDQRGTCPECGAELTPVPFYSANRLGTDVARRRIDSTTQVKTTTTHYNNISPRYAGWCEACARRDWDAKEEATALRRPNPALLIAASLLLAVGLAGIIRMLVTGEDTGLYAAIGAISLIFGLILFPWTLVAFIKKRRLHAKYAAGWRAPFERNLDRLSSGVVIAMLKRATGSQTYLSTSEVKSMQGRSPW